MRIVMITMVSIINTSPEFYSSRKCGQIDYMQGREQTLAQYPDCAAFYSGEDPNKYVQVLAQFGTSASTTASAFGVSFGPSGWLSLLLHAIGIEIYVCSPPPSRSPR